MNVFITSAIVALYAVETCWASAPLNALEKRAVPVVQFFIGGGFISVEQGYANYTITVPEDGSTVPITNPIDVYTIIPSDEDSDCTFVGADGTTIRFTGSQQDILVQPLTSVTCAARSGPVVTPTGFPNFTSFFPTLQTVAPSASVTSATASSTSYPVSTSSITPSATRTGSSILPPYPLSTTSSSKVGIATASASAPSGTAFPTGGFGTGSTVPFTGHAAKAVKSVAGSFLAFVGLFAAL